MGSPVPFRILNRIRCAFQRAPWAVGIGGGLLIGVLMFEITEEEEPGHNTTKPPAALLGMPSVKIREDGFENAGEFVRPELVNLVSSAGAPPDVSEIRTLMEFDSDLSNLTPVEVDELLRVLLAGGPGGASIQRRASFVHLIANVLHSEIGASRRFAEVLGRLAADGAQPDMIRDYAVQHLSVVWDDAKPHEQGRLRESIILSLRELAAGHDVTGDAALLSLHSLGSSRRPDRPGKPAVPDKVFADIVLTSLESRDQRLDRRLLAVRIAGERRMMSCLPELRRIAGGGAAHSMLRRSAIAALGRMGSEDDSEFLSTIAANEPQYRSAVEHALARSSR